MNIGVFSVGLGRIDLHRLCRLLADVPGPFEFVPGSSLAKMSNPDLYGYGFSDQAFRDLMRPHTQRFDISVVVTGVPIEDNFFTRTIDGRLVVATFFQADEILAKSGRTAEEYAALAICQELVSFEFQRVSGLPWSALFHQDPRACLFDFAGIKTQKVAKLSACYICDECLGKLDSHNVDPRVKTFARALLRRIRRPSFGKAFRICVAAPGLSFLYGGLVVGTAVNLYSSVLMSRSPLTAVQRTTAIISCAVVILFPACVLAWLYISEVRRRIR